MSPWFAFTVAALAVFRVTELVVLDAIFERFRKAFRSLPWIYLLVTCFFCCSEWVSLVAALYAWYLGYTDLRHFFGWWQGIAGAAVVIHQSVRPRN